jgi:hypothetical protein
MCEQAYGALFLFGVAVPEHHIIRHTQLKA